MGGVLRIHEATYDVDSDLEASEQRGSRSDPKLSVVRGVKLGFAGSTLGSIPATTTLKRPGPGQDLMCFSIALAKPFTL